MGNILKQKLFSSRDLCRPFIVWPCNSVTICVQGSYFYEYFLINTFYPPLCIFLYLISSTPKKPRVVGDLNNNLYNLEQSRVVVGAYIRVLQRSRINRMCRYILWMYIQIIYHLILYMRGDPKSGIYLLKIVYLFLPV